MFMMEGGGILISTHAPRTGSDFSLTIMVMPMLISTHAPRTGSDLSSCQSLLIENEDFNPRSPHGERPARSGMYHAPQ